MPESALRSSPIIDGGHLARWGTVALLCAVVLAVCVRGRIVGEPHRKMAMQSELCTASSMFLEEPLPVVPDFLEPLPLIEEAADVELPIEENLTPPLPVLEPSLPVIETEAEIEEPPSESLLPVEESEPKVPELTLPVEDVLPMDDAAEAIESSDVVEPSKPAEYEDDDAETAAQLTPEELLTFSPSVAEISQKLLPEVRAAFQLSQHGATHAAHGRFVQVLRRIARAKDVEEMTERYTRSLNEGLRALDEADDFMPAGREPALDLEVIAATHQTPMLKVHQSRYTLPHEAVALYHRFAQQKLGAAVAGEQAGSMALHGLGKIHARWAEIEGDSLIAARHSMTMYRAALVAHPRNHLAANELGVMLARAGRYDQAAVPLEWAAQLAGTATIYHNLAIVQQNRGQTALAVAAKSQADRLAMLERTSGEVSRRHGVQWVSPQEMARMSDGNPAEPQSTAITTPPTSKPSAPRQATITPAPRGGTWR